MSAKSFSVTPMGESPERHLDSLYRNHRSWLCQWISQRLGCHHQAEELAQETFIRVLRQRQPSLSSPCQSASHYLPQPLQQPRAYLSSIARNLIVDRFRRVSIEQAYLDALAAQPEPLHASPEAHHCVIETLVQIDQLLTELGPRSREIFLLAQVEGHSYVHISQTLGLSVTTVRKHCIKVLTQCLLLLETE